VARTGHVPDFSVPNPARVYDLLLGGKDNLPADREQARLLTDPATGCPDLPGLVAVNRRFVIRAVRWSASHLRIAQFLDLGCGLPRRPSVHETAREYEPEARIVYIDNDPVVLSHARAVQAEQGWGDGIAVLAGDASDPAAVLADGKVRGLLDFAQPAACVFGGTLSNMSADTARAAVEGFAEAMAPGSAVVISCIAYADLELGERQAALCGAAGTWRNHSLEDVASFFAAAGLRVAQGRVSDVRCWPMAADADGDAMVLGGVGVKD
jgi:hypothetical protein